MIKIYTDGACSGNPGAGGYGIVVFNNDDHIVLYESLNCDNTTNNKEELKAVIRAFEIVENRYKEEKCIIYSDSAYVVNICNDWIYRWCKNNWCNSKNKPILNLPYIQTLYKYCSKKNLDCQVVKINGHANILGNELADALATGNTTKCKKLLASFSEVENFDKL